MLKLETPWDDDEDEDEDVPHRREEDDDTVPEDDPSEDATRARMTTGTMRTRSGRRCYCSPITATVTVTVTSVCSVISDRELAHLLERALRHPQAVLDLVALLLERFDDVVVGDRAEETPVRRPPSA